MFKYLICFLLSSHLLFADNKVVSYTLLKSYKLAQLDSLYKAYGVPTAILGLTYDVKLYKVVYHTVQYDNTPTIASGLLLVPNSTYCETPVAAYMHGTIVNKEDVPSRLKGAEYLIGMALASGGTLTVMPDYLGLGDGPGYHPYQNSKTEATATVDLLRTARQLKDTLQFVFGKQLFLIGYSQGGHAAMATHKYIQENLGGEFSVTASAPMSGAFSMTKIMVDVMLSDSAYPSPYYLPYLIIGNNPIYKFYPSADSFMKKQYADTLVKLFDGTYGPGQIDAIMPTVPKLIVRTDKLDSFINDTNHFFRLFLKDNDLTSWVPTSPVKMFYCTGDRSVSYQNSILTYQKMKSLGATLIDTFNVGASDHGECAQTALIFGKFWFDSMKNKAVTSEEFTKKNLDNSYNVTLFLADGKPPYSVTWSNADTGTNVNLKAGTYTYTIKDQHCANAFSKTITVGNSEINSATAPLVQVFPNPVSGWLQIKSSLAMQLKAIKTYDCFGNMLHNYTGEIPSQIDFSNCAPGVYFTDIYFENLPAVKHKIIKP